MYPILFEIFGQPVGTYGVCIILGAVAAGILIHRLAITSAATADTAFITYAAVMCICGAFAGALLLRPLTKIPELFIHWEQFRGRTAGEVMGFLFGEMVFYGGLIGAGIALYIYCTKLKISLLPFAALFAPGIALAHAFGRVGCFFGGCCYGIGIDGHNALAVRYPVNTAGGAPPGEPLLPLPLIEAAALLIIAVILCTVYKKSQIRHRDMLTVCLYGTLYPVTRFILEYYRGDSIRGIYGPFSTSQYISAGIFIFSICYAIIFFHCQLHKRGERQQ